MGAAASSLLRLILRTPRREPNGSYRRHPSHTQRSRPLTVGHLVVLAAVPLVPQVVSHQTQLGGIVGRHCGCIAVLPPVLGGPPDGRQVAVVWWVGTGGKGEERRRSVVTQGEYPDR